MVDGQVQRELSTSSQDIFFKDCIDRGEVSVDYQPTEKMYSDILTKLKQGKAFQVDWAILLNFPEDDNNTQEKERMHPSLLEKAQVMQAVMQA